MPVTGKLDFPNKANVILILGEVYHDIRDALAEFITNADDAKATAIMIMSERGGKRSKITISDNGHGMNLEVLKTVPVSIGDSMKKFDRDTVGEKGIGILGFQAIADKCEIISRDEAEEATHKLTLWAGKDDYLIEFLADVRPFAGTDVVLSGLKAEKMRAFAQASLVNWLKQKFRMDLINNKYRLDVIERTKQVPVLPDAYKGEPFYIRNVDTKFGRANLDLYISPRARTLKVRIAHKGRLAIDDIATLSGFEHDPWIAGKVQGEITCDFCKQTSGRRGFVQDRKKWPVWVNAVQSIEGQLQREINRLMEEDRRITDAKMYKRLDSAFSKALKEFEQMEAFATRFVHAGGQEVEGTAGDRTVRGVAGGRQGRGGGKRAVKPARSITRALSGKGFNWDETEFHDAPHLHSRFSEKMQLIEINTLHEDYKRETREEESKLKYLAKLGSKEIILYNHPDIGGENQLEKMIQLELCVLRHL